MGITKLGNEWGSAKQVEGTASGKAQRWELGD
jgi:hypothetical protein